MNPVTARRAEAARGRPIVLLTFCLLLSIAAPAAAQGEADPPAEPDPLGIDWLEGPAVGELGSIATLEVPEGYIFAGPEDTRKLMEAMQNPTNGSEMGFIAPADADWFVVFEFDDIGYVKDDERAELDGEAILESLRQGQEAGNEMRRQRGWETLEVVGWMQPPHYDAQSNNLEWATHLRSSSGAENVNYNSRLLGRSGVMRATLVGSEESVAANMDTFKSLLAAHQYVSGQRYAEFREGDKIAKYGLTALITGGAAAVALKTGLFKKLWKFIVLGAAAVIAALKKFFTKPVPSPDQEGDSTSA